MAELPRLSTRKHQYPEDDYMKDNLRIKCLSHYKTTRSAAEYWKPKGYYGDETSTYTLPNYTSKYTKSKIGAGGAKWEEPDTVYSSASERKPYSKSAEGDDDDLKKERRKKKKSKERDEPLAIDSSSVAAAAPAAEASSEASAAAPAAPVAAASESADAPAEPEAELDEKEKKRLEKKKRKAEREAAAKAAMEAELEALAEAELELARLEAESSNLKGATETKDEPSPTAPAEPAGAATEDKASEKATEKCESPVEAPCDVLPECPPTQFECEPSSLFPSGGTSGALEEPFQVRVEEEEAGSAQDLSAEKFVEVEPAEQVIETQDEPQFTEEHGYEPEPIVTTDDYEPRELQESGNDEQLPTFKSEAYLSDECVDAPVDQSKEGDDFDQQIGDEQDTTDHGEGGEQHQEEDVLQEQQQEPVPEQQELPEELEQEEEEQEPEPEVPETSMPYDEDVDIFAGRED